MSDNHHEEAHTGPIKNPKQLLVAVLFSFVVPIFAIIGWMAALGVWEIPWLDPQEITPAEDGEEGEDGEER